MAQWSRVHIAEDPSLVPSTGILRLTSLLTAAPDLCGHQRSHVGVGAPSPEF